MVDDKPGFIFATEREAAGKLLDAAVAHGVRLHPLPYSRFDPDRSTWWLSPTSANPAYAVGKLVVERPSIVEDGSKLIGLHMEKGVGVTAAPFFGDSARGRRLIMERHWTWHPFIRAMRDGVLDRDMQAAELAADGWPLTVEVVASTQALPPLDGADERPIDPESVERVRYRYSAGILAREAHVVARRLGSLEASETLASIAEKIGAIGDLDWTWIELLVGVPFRPVSDDGATPTDVWRRVCAPWTAWLR